MLFLFIAAICVVLVAAACFVRWAHSKPKEEKVDNTPSALAAAFDAIHSEKAKPDMHRGLILLIHALDSGEEMAALEIAKIYMRGIHPTTKSNKVVGGKICKWIADNPRFSRHCRAFAKDLALEEMRYEHGEIGTDPEPLPEDIVSIMNEHLENVDTLLHIQTPEHRQVPLVPVPTDADADADADADVPLRHVRTTVTPIAATIATVTFTQNPILGDSQNVHSSAVQNAANQTLQRISKGVDSVTGFAPVHTGDINAFMVYLDSQSCDIDIQEKEKVKRVIATLQSDIPHSRYNKTEAEVFSNTWSHISRPDNDNKENMARIFAQSLASAVEHDHVVCSTGKIVRMIGSLDGMEEENNNSPSLKPEWALDVEIGSLAAKVRGDVLSTLTSEQRQDYDNDNERGAEVVKTMRETFILKARSEYGTLISPALLDAKIEGFADAL